MKFYDREQELNQLNTLLAQTKDASRMTVLIGRRRVGKILLALEFAKNHKFIYFFISKKSEALLCAECLEDIKREFNVPIVGEIRSFKDIFHLLLQLAEKKPFTLIIDEFQEFYNINPAVYSEIQKLWDLNKQRCRLNLIVIGSVYSLMHKIFENSREPLFSRADRLFSIQPFAPATINVILEDYRIQNINALFDYYVFTGGMPKYIDLLIENKACALDEIINFVIEANSPFLHEGKNLLIEEFGKEYGTYFSILELIAMGKTSRSEVESILEINVGGYLDRLEKDYAIIARYKPIHAKPQSRSQKYRITDNFLNFWFRFIYRNRSAVETGNFGYVRELVKRDYNSYCGRILEKFFHDLLAQTGQYNRIGSYWEKGNENEIDLVAINDMEKKILLAEVKMNKMKIDIETLKQKSKRLIMEFPRYNARYLSLGLEDAKNYLPPKSSPLIGGY